MAEPKKSRRDRREPSALGVKLERARKMKGLSQAGLAVRSRVSNRTIGELEMGVRQTVREDVLIKLALGLEGSVEAASKWLREAGISCEPSRIEHEWAELEALRQASISKTARLERIVEAFDDTKLERLEKIGEAFNDTKLKRLSRLAEIVAQPEELATFERPDQIIERAVEKALARTKEMYQPPHAIVTQAVRAVLASIAPQLGEVHRALGQLEERVKSSGERGAPRSTT